MKLRVVLQSNPRILSCQYKHYKAKAKLNKEEG